jgi:hypothetical protein
MFKGTTGIITSSSPIDSKPAKAMASNSSSSLGLFLLPLVVLELGQKKIRL